MVRFGASICFAAYNALLDRWVMIANGSEEILAVPSLWWCTDQRQDENNALTQSVIPPLTQTKMRRSRRPQQLSLFG